MSDLSIETPLTHKIPPSDLYVNMQEISDIGMIDLRGSAQDPQFLSVVQSVLSITPPVLPRHSVTQDVFKILWLSIDQWLILCPRSQAPELTKSLAQALNGHHSFVVNVSDMRVIIRLEGPAVKEVVLKGTSLDLLGADCQPGYVKRLKFAEVAALLHINENDVIDLYVFRSYAEYVWNFLSKVARNGSEVSLFLKR